MIGSKLFKLATPFLRSLDAEQAHSLAIQGLQLGIYPRAPKDKAETLKVSLFGLDFPNPLGMAAGFDKNAEVTNALHQLGLGFTEAGTITPRPQDGNPKPRIFRIPQESAVINRLGFNNKGHSEALKNLKSSRKEGIIGINVGANKDSDDRVADYVAGIKFFAEIADYFTLNISSPNTSGLRDLQAEEALIELLSRCIEARDEVAAAGRKIPLLLKIAPDLEESDIQQICEVVRQYPIEGMIVSNTTISRPIPDHLKNGTEQGGLSGAPLFDLSTRRLAQVFHFTEGKIPLVGVGGIDNAEKAYEKICAGASLIQIYTGFVYKGPELITDIKQGLVKKLQTDGFSHISEAVGTGVSK